jgi:hypothetical protein
LVFCSGSDIAKHEPLDVGGLSADEEKHSFGGRRPWPRAIGDLQGDGRYARQSLETRESFSRKTLSGINGGDEYVKKLIHTAYFVSHMLLPGKHGSNQAIWAGSKRPFAVQWPNYAQGIDTPARRTLLVGHVSAIVNGSGGEGADGYLRSRVRTQTCWQ